ncbi:MAG: hypothetical protein V3V61_00825 [Gammaproteobacteria bacterium]
MQRMIQLIKIVLLVSLVALPVNINLSATPLNLDLSAPDCNNCNICPVREKMIFPEDDYEYRWAFVFLYGWQLEGVMNKAMRFSLPLSEGEQRSRLYTGEVSYQLKRQNVVRRMLQPILSTMEVAANYTWRDDPNGQIQEFNPYLRFTWNNFPWNKYLITALTLGEGLSYATGFTSRETRDTIKANDVRRLLNFFMLEAAFSLPKIPQWQAVYRIHHRSGMFGLYAPGIVGSTAIQIGVRYQHFQDYTR